MLTVEDITRIIHNNHYRYDVIESQSTSVPWEQLSNEDQIKIQDLVEKHLLSIKEGEIKHPSIAHNKWFEMRKAQGWVFAKEYSLKNKEHPALKPYKMLSSEQKVRNMIYLVSIWVAYNKNNELYYDLDELLDVLGCGSDEDRLKCTNYVRKVEMQFDELLPQKENESCLDNFTKPVHRLIISSVALGGCVAGSVMTTLSGNEHLSPLTAILGSGALASLYGVYSSTRSCIESKTNKPELTVMDGMYNSHTVRMVHEGVENPSKRISQVTLQPLKVRSTDNLVGIS